MADDTNGYGWPYWSLAIAIGVAAWTLHGQAEKAQNTADDARGTILVLQEELKDMRSRLDECESKVETLDSELDDAKSDIDQIKSDVDDLDSR